MPSILPLHIGVFLRASADVLLYAYLPIYLRTHLGETRFWLISLVPTVPAFVRFVMAPLWGRLADRLGSERPFVVMGLAAYGVLLAALPHMTRTPTIIVTLALFAVPFSAFNPISRAWLTLGDRGGAVLRLARWYQWEAAGFVVSSALVGSFAGGHPLAFVQALRFGGTLLIACAVATGAFLRGRPVREGGATRYSLSAQQSPSAAPNRHAGTHAPLPIPALLFLVSASLAWESVASSFGLYFTETLSGTVQTYGFTLSGSTFISLFAYGLLAGTGRRRGEGPLFRAAALGYTLMFFIIALPSPWTAAFGYLLPMGTVVRTAVNLLIVQRVPEYGRGQAMGAVEAAEAWSSTLGALLGGMLADHFGLSFIPQVALCSTLILHILHWKLRR